MATCPHCNRYTLGFWEQSRLSNRIPRTCPKCGGLFVSYLGADLIWILATGIVFASILVVAHGRMTLSAALAIYVPLFLTRAFFVKPIPYEAPKPSGRRADTDGGFVGCSDFPALIAALKDSGRNGSFWVVLIPGTEKVDGLAANLQFSIEDDELGMDWVLIAQSNLELKGRFLRLASFEGLKPQEVEQNGVKYVRATGDKDWPNIGKKILEQMFDQDKLTKMPLIVTGFQWKPIQ